MINIYPFYGQVRVETGWPRMVFQYGRGTPPSRKQRIFTDAVIAGLAKTGSTFLFEGLDEPWLKVQNSWGPHWGLWNSDSPPASLLASSAAQGIMSRFPSGNPDPALINWMTGVKVRRSLGSR